MNAELVTGFDWDHGNARKNDKHCVSMTEVEEIFLNAPRVMAQDEKHSQNEERENTPWARLTQDAGSTSHLPYGRV